MKNTLITLTVALALGLASCGGNTDANKLTQEQLDSAKAVFEDSVRLAEQAKNDSLAAIEAQRVADSTQAAIDSLTKAANKKVSTVSQKQTQKPSTIKVSEGATEVPAAAKDEKSTSNRPGAKTQSNATNSASSDPNVKSTSNRPGAK